MRTVVTDFVKSCRACQLCAKEKNKLYSHYQLVTYIFDTFSTDFAGPLPEKKKKCRYIQLGVEHLTDWINARETIRQAADIEI